jgi:hypothetical protein
MPSGRFRMSLMFVAFGLACGTQGEEGEVPRATPRVLEDTPTQSVDRRATQAQWSRDGRVVAWIETDGAGRAVVTRVADASSGEVRELWSTAQPVSMTLAADGVSVAIVTRADGREQIELWSVAEAVPRFTLPAHVEGRVRFAADGASLVWSDAAIASGSTTATMHVLDVHTFRHELRTGATTPSGAWTAPAGNGRPVLRVSEPLVPDAAVTS